MSEHQRRLKRQEIATHVTITNSLTGELVGELVNITVEGLMIISDDEVDTNSIFQFTLALPEKIERATELNLGVDCLWCRKAENFNRYWSGYQIIDASPEALRTIDALIKNYAA